MISIGKLSQMKLNKIPIFKLDYEEDFIKELNVPAVYQNY